MSWFGKIAFGSVGLFVGGPLGAIAGAALGHHFVDKKDRGRSYDGPSFQRFETRVPPEQIQATYFVCIFSILGKIAKADGVVSKDEIAVVENFINTMNISTDEAQFAKQVFIEAKDDTAYSIDDFAAQFFQLNKNNPLLLQSFLDILFQVAAADGVLHRAEETDLEKIKNVFGISDHQFENLKARYFKETDKYYKALNCTTLSSNDEIKTNYRKLVKDFHPDTIIAKGLPEEFTNFASTRFREIQEAYEHLKKERGL
ncbi:MAG: DnaJ domain-containing protein [Deltaproteobacteria bacterium]|nr:DnaJ domain-containing protein [Deltaproteobacteria bacterium]